MPKKSIPESIIHWANIQPDAPAIFEFNGEVTYEELCRRAATVARQLHDLGAVKGELVPIMTEGGADMVAGMLACLQRASVFVPIDVGAPVERTKKMLKDLSCRFAIVDVGLDVTNLLRKDVKILRPLAGEKFEACECLGDDTTIYGFFTSGSTGTPKCCLNTHLGLANRFAFNTAVRPLTAGDAVMQNSKHTFDPVLWQTLWPLTRGAAVVIPKRGGLLDIEKTIKLIDQHHVVMTDIVPSVLSVLLDFLELRPDEASRLNSLGELFVGGEEISSRLVQRSLNLLPWVRLTNTYGPTEAAIGMIFHHFDGTEDANVPLGNPIPGTSCAVVDEDLKPVPDGTTGQLVIAGHCLGKGYLNDVTKTNSAFKTIILPSGATKHFLTGDRAVRKNGKIFFRGRSDKQIKIRGVRVELKEIEETYESHSEITQLRVVPVESIAGDYRLHAFLTTRSNITLDELRQFGQVMLPTEFIPSSFKQISEFQTTSAGKIDRAFLKKLAFSTESKESETTLQSVTNIVEEYFDRAIAPNEDLFLAGLDSLNAMRLTMSIEKQFSKSLSTSQLYANPTIFGMEEYLSSFQIRSSKHTEKQPDFSYWCNIDLPTNTSPKVVLLTGATGYLGAHLLVELSNKPNTKVICLVRGNSLTTAVHRLHKASIGFALHQSVDWNRVEVILGDLSKIQLGIDSVERERLSGTLSAIYNAGADVSFVKPLRHLEAVNIQAVISLAEIAMSASDCHLHHVSSTAALSMTISRLDLNPEVRDVPLANGYAQSKFAAELSMKALMDKGLKATVYRVGEIMPSPTYISPNPRSSVVCYLRTLAYVRTAPDTNDTVDYCPVDTVAKTIASYDNPVSKFVGLANQKRVSLVELVAAMNGYGSQILSCDRQSVFNAIRSASREVGPPDFVSITWDTIKKYGADVHWPIMSFSEQTVHRLGSVEGWPKIDTKYLSVALSRMVMEQGAMPIAAADFEKT